MKAIRGKPHRFDIVRVLGLYFVLGVCVFLASAEGDANKQEFFKARFLKARSAYEAEQSNTNLAIQYAASAFEWAEHATSKAARSAIAEPAIVACRKHLDSKLREAETRYYLALNLGQLARTRYISALSIVSEMERILLAAKALDPTTNYAGIDRALSQLYARAPKWPASVGSRSKALEHARRAITLAPDYPGNQINLLELLIDQQKLSEARKALPEALLKMQSAREALDSEYWSFSWSEWEQKLERIRFKISSPAP